MATERPGRLSPPVIEQIALTLFAEIKQWLESYGDAISEREEMEAFGTLKRALSESSNWDGYALAKQLDELGWEPDAELVAILQDAERVSLTCYRETIIRWVKENKLKPKYKPSAHIEFKAPGTQETLNAKVMVVHPETLEYSIKLETRSDPIHLVVYEESICG